MMTEGVLFGAGVVVALTWPVLTADTGFWIVPVVVASVILAAPIAGVDRPSVARSLLAAKSHLGSRRVLVPREKTRNFRVQAGR
jgi:hypothetical protein